MNGQARVSSPIKLALLSGAAMSLAACAEIPKGLPGGPTAVDPASPAKAQIEAVLAKPEKAPTFADIPPVPADAPDPDAVREAVAAEQLAGQELLADTAPQTWDLNESEAFEARARADVGDATAPTDAEIAASEAFARQMRERAKAPPRPRQ